MPVEERRAIVNRQLLPDPEKTIEFDGIGDLEEDAANLNDDEDVPIASTIARHTHLLPTKLGETAINMN